MKTLRLILFPMLFAVSILANAYDFEVDGFYYDVNLENMTATVVAGGIPYEGDIEIPNKVIYKSREFDVIAINGAFSGNTNLTGVTIPTSITSLGKSSFEGCSALTRISGMENLMEIGESCFSGCKSLTSISIPKGLSIIPNEAFYGCCSLTELIIPENIDSIGNSAFQNCFKLATIKLPETITILSNGLFKNCDSLCNIDVPASLTVIEDEVFSGCQKLESIIIPSNVRKINNMVFNGCLNLKNVYFENSDTILSVGYGQKDSPSRVYGLFYGIPIEELYLGRDFEYPSDEGIYLHLDDERTYYHGYAPFQSCGLKKVTISNSVTKIKSYTFYNCKELYEIEIPSSVTSIGDYAFSKSSIQTLTVKDGLNYLAFDMKVRDIKNDNTPHTFTDCVNLNNVYWGRNIVVGSVSSNGSSSPSTFLPTSITEIEIGNYVHELSYLQLYNQNISSSLSHYPELKRFKIGCSIPEMPVLSKNQQLTDLIICSPIPIKASSFSNVQYMDLSVEVPTGSKSKYEEAEIWSNFWNVKETENLNSNVIFHNNLMYALLDSNNNIGLLKSPTEFMGNICIPNHINCNSETYTVTSIGRVFKNSSNLISVDLPESITQLDDECFYGCSSLESVSLGAELESIGEWAFYKCTSLKTLSIPGTVKSFGIRAFQDSKIEYLIIEDGDTPLKMPYSYAGSEFRKGSYNYTAYVDTYFGYFANTKIGKLYLGRDIIDSPEVSAKYGGTSYFTCYNDPFYGISSLRTIIIGPNTSKIGSKASTKSNNGITVTNGTSFYGGYGYIDVYVQNIIPPIGVSFSSDAYRYGSLTVPVESKELYMQAEGWKSFKNIKSDITKIDEIIIDHKSYSNSPIDIFNLNGVKVVNSKEKLSPGVYITRQGDKVKKIRIQ